MVVHLGDRVRCMYASSEAYAIVSGDRVDGLLSRTRRAFVFRSDAVMRGHVISGGRASVLAIGHHRSEFRLGEFVIYLGKAIYDLLMVRCKNFAIKCDALLVCCLLSLHCGIPPLWTMAQNEWYDFL